ncbi:MAG: Na+/H+ antiporter subunit E [Micrococcaceae bacterium]
MRINKTDIFLYGWLVFFWCVLWRSISPFTIFGGFIVAALVTFLFRLPKMPDTYRFNIWYIVSFLVWFIYELFVASIDVTKILFAKGSKVQSAIFAVPVMPVTDFTLTLISHTATLVPGSTVIDVDYTNHVIYLQAIDMNSEVDKEPHIRDILLIQDKIIKAIGTRQEYEMLKERTEK